MLTIWKYTLNVEDRQTIEIPIGYELLGVQVQSGTPCLWVKVDTRAQQHPVTIIIHGTGHPADDTNGMQYVGTFQLHDGYFVGHVFAEPGSYR